MSIEDQGKTQGENSQEQEPTPVNTITIQARISHYTPWTGGTNCSQFVNGECISHMASGLDWRDYIDQACACPVEYPFGTVFVLPDGSEWTCLDRGGAIVTADGIPWLDLLTEHAPVSYGTILPVQIKEN